VLKKEMMFLIGQKGKIPQLFVFKKPIVVKRLKNFGRMNAKFRNQSTISYTTIKILQYTFIQTHTFIR
jgi:hypothetical protein